MLKSRTTVLDMLAYGLSACFAAAGLATLAAGDSRIERNRFIRTSVNMVGTDRVLFGFALLSVGYLFLRWLFRTPGAERRWSVELQVIAAFAVTGYVAYRLGLG